MGGVNGTNIRYNEATDTIEIYYQNEWKVYRQGIMAKVPCYKIYAYDKSASNAYYGIDKGVLVFSTNTFINGTLITRINSNPAYSDNVIKSVSYSNLSYVFTIYGNCRTILNKTDISDAIFNANEFVWRLPYSSYDTLYVIPYQF